jgi:hypothetical protein
MPTTRPGFIWSGTEWVAIGQEAVVNPFYYQATAPTGAATGAIWIESDVDVPSIDSSQFLRWRKTMTGGETSLSGNDDSSLPLAYTPGYEQLYINGVLQVRGGDYTATTGTTVTGLTALVANDVVEIFSAVARTVADVYTQTQVDAKIGTNGWVTWTPTTTGITVGNGTLITKYSLIGKTCNFKFFFKLGSTSAITSPVSFTLPFAVNQTSDFQIADFPLMIHDAGAAVYYGRADVGFSTSNNNIVEPFLTSTTGTYASPVSLSATVPMTWTTSDKLVISGTYEAA